MYIFDVLISQKVKTEALEKKLRDSLITFNSEILAGIDFSSVRVNDNHIFLRYRLNDTESIELEIYLSDTPPI